MKVAQVVLPVPINKNFSYNLPENLKDEDVLFKRVRVPFGTKTLTGFCIAIETDFKSNDSIKIKDIIEVLDDKPILNKESLEMGKWLSENYLCSFGEALATIVPVSLTVPKSTLKLKKNLKSKETSNIELNSYQAKACAKIFDCIDKNENKSFLLHGVTGSGKTEVYLRCIQKAIDNNKSAIFLLPEISLTPQFIDILNKKFGNIVALWHSGVTKIQKYKIFDAIKAGNIKIVVGARSAIFLPFTNLGLVIIDEEHENTYKQNNKPSYDAKEIALWRAKYNSAVVIFGSATPSIEIYKRCLDKKIDLIEMPYRIDKKPLPNIEMVSLKTVKGRVSVFSKKMLNAIKTALARREQVIIFLNKRGFSSSIACDNCDTLVQCPNCSISFVYHKNPEVLKCHYCGTELKFPIKCSKCGKTHFRTIGTGTQRVEEELKKLFPHTKIFRLDADTATSKTIYSKVYEGIKNEEYSILLGTQMVTKGFDFPRVSLVCVVNADMSLYLPDFRSSERTFQLITQVAGRCGRGKIKGKVLVQTMYPENYALELAQKYDYKSFFEQELNYRKELNYPPFCNIAKITVRNADEEKALKFTEKLYGFIDKQIMESNYYINLLGPSQSYIFKANGTYRWQLILKGARKELKTILEKIESINIPNQTYINIELDPNDLL